MSQTLTNLQKIYIQRLLKGELKFEKNKSGLLKGTDISFQQAIYALVDEVFVPHSQQLIYTSSITQKVASYCEKIDFLIFIQNRFNELGNGGIWINNDIIRPESSNQIVFLWLNDADGADKSDVSFQQASTLNKFKRFAEAYSKSEKESLIQEIIEIDRQKFACLSLRDACEFALSLNNTEKGIIEIQEKTCNLKFTDWQKVLQNTDFNILPQSKTYQNEAFIETIKGKIALFDEDFEPMEFPNLQAMILAEKI